jgi:two-component system NtrC family sensor kinase
MPNEKVLVILSDPGMGTMLEQGTLIPAGYQVTFSTELATAEMLLVSEPPDLVLLGDQVESHSGLALGADWMKRYPALPVILLALKPEAELPLKALRMGFADCLQPPIKPDQVLKAVEHGLQRRRQLLEWAGTEFPYRESALRLQLDHLETLQQVGRSVTSLLDLDAILTAVVDAAVELTGAEEGSLLLLDAITGELYMRAARNFQDEFVRKFRLPIQDTLAGQVVRTGQALALHENTPQKIKTAYMVYTLIYVPMQVHGRVIGVLGVDNRRGGPPFTEDHQRLMAALADYAAIAVENASAYERLEQEHQKLVTILAQVEDAVIVADPDGRLVLANRAARQAFGMHAQALVGSPLRELVSHAELIGIFDQKSDAPTQYELKLEDGRVFHTQVTAIDGVGRAVTMQDITHLKELDRIKSDFVNAVSHDLRSPLTAILGYVELIGRVGPVTAQQRNFINRIQVSVQNITALINDLLELGRIEAGFDARRENLPIGTVIRFALEGLREQFALKDQSLLLNLPAEQVQVLGNVVHLRQMMNNLLSNASKFTPKSGRIQVNCWMEDSQVILQVIDNGPGIPPADQPYVFDKFYRGSNISYDIPGTGLGLAIVKSIVEDHQGRVWVNSQLGQGTSFTVVLPVADAAREAG